MESSSACSNDERTLSSRSRLVVESRIFARYQHTHDEDSQDVKDRHAREHSFAGLWNSNARISRLCCSHGYAFNTGEAEDCIAHNCPITQKLAPTSCRDVLHEEPRVIPVSEADALRAWHTAEVNDQTEKDQEDLANVKTDFC